MILRVEKDNCELATLSPQVRFYPVERSQTSEASMYHNFFYDLYAVISEVKQDGEVSVRFYFKPLISWMWMILGICSACGMVILFINNKKNKNKK